MNTQITCYGVTDGFSTFKIITYRPPLEAVKSELKTLFRNRNIKIPMFIKWKQTPTEITASYSFKDGGQKEKVKLTFNIEYI